MSTEYAQPTSADYTREYFAILESLHGRRARPPGRAAPTCRRSTAIVPPPGGGRPPSCPRLFGAAAPTDVMKRDGRDRPPHPRQGHRALPGRPRLPPRLRPRPAPRKSSSCLPRGYDAVLPFARVDTFLERGRRPRQVLRVQRRRLVGHEREPRDHRIRRAARRRSSEFAGRHQVAGCELFESLGRHVPAHLRHLREPGGHPARRHLSTILENAVVDEFRVLRAACSRQPRRAVRRRRRAASSALRRRGAARRPGAAHRRRLAPLRHERRHRPLGRVPAAHRRRAGGQKVALIGSFAGHLAHDKQLFKRAVRPCAPPRFWTPTRCPSWRRPCRSPPSWTTTTSTCRRSARTR